MADKLKKVTKAHTRYYLSDGTLVPGATTVTGLLNKPALVKWANNLGLQGIDSSKYVDKAARVGTLIHALVEAHITGKKADLSDYTDLEKEMADVGFKKYLDWEKQHKVEPIFNEKQFVSEKYKYGGTLDFYCKVDGKLTLIDFKSGKGIFNEHFLQVSSYANLLTENKYKVEQIMILNIGRNEDEPFDHKEIKPTTIKKYFKMFRCLLDVYYIKKDLEWK
ncbi:MAG: hypothetical protein OSJ74_08960 [Clostridia bacterium]|nr:hypothetical protein [Clostridia bacterium]